jgi:hypothetical protein
MSIQVAETVAEERQGGARKRLKAKRKPLSEIVQGWSEGYANLLLLSAGVPHEYMQHFERSQVAIQRLLVQIECSRPIES